MIAVSPARFTGIEGTLHPMASCQTWRIRPASSIASTVGAINPRHRV
jgi:hypothetical protein